MNISRLYEELDVQFQRYFSSNILRSERYKCNEIQEPVHPFQE